jgi:hypothetical protein
MRPLKQQNYGSRTIKQDRARLSKGKLFVSLPNCNRLATHTIRGILARVACFSLNELAITEKVPEDVRLRCNKSLKGEPNATFLRRLKLHMASDVEPKDSFLSLNTLANSVSTHQNIERGIDQIDYWK